MTKIFQTGLGVLCLVLLFSMAAPACAADSDFTIENSVLTKYNGAGGAVVIPDGVTVIGYRAFYGCTNVKSVTIPDSVTSTEDDVFYGCTGLTSVTIPNSVTNIGYRAFYGCTSLTSITIPNNVMRIDSSVFYQCSSLTSVTIPAGVTSIGDHAFAQCSSLTSVTVPDSVTRIGSDAFDQTPWLEEQCKKNDFVMTVNQTLLKYGGSGGDVVIPAGVKKISDSAFYGCAGLTGVTIPDGVTNIGYSAFQDCSHLTSITIPASVTTIGSYAFWNCTNLTDITIPASVTVIGSQAFAYSENEQRNPYHPLPVTIYGVAGSAAESYAKKNGIEFVAGAAPASQTSAPSTPLAYVSNQTVQVDGKSIQFQMYALKDAKGNPTNYVRVRDVAQILNGTAAQFNVTWDGSVNLVPKTAYIPPATGDTKAPFSGNRAYKKTTSGTKVNGTVTSLDAFILTDDSGGGHTYYKLRDLGENLGFNVGWSQEKGIYIETNKPYQKI